MGNILSDDSSNIVKSTSSNVGSKINAKIATNGNKTNGHNDGSTFTKEEYNCIESIYNDIKTDSSSDPIKSATLKVMLNRVGCYTDIKSLCKFISKVTKSKSEDAINYLWGLVRKYRVLLIANGEREPYKETVPSSVSSLPLAAETATAVAAVVLIDSELEIFLRIIMELCGTFTSDEVTRLVSSFKALIERCISSSTTNDDGDDASYGRTVVPDVTVDVFYNWTRNYSSSMPRLIESFITLSFFHSISKPSFNYFLLPHLVAEKGTMLSTSDVLALSLYSPLLQSTWKQILSSNSDGYGFNSVVHALLGYDGNTVIVIRTAKINGLSHIIGAFSNTRWKDTNKFYGSSSNFLFTLSPHMQILRGTGATGNNQWLNTRGYKLSHGIGFGGCQQRFRLFIPDTMETCTANAVCTDYECGKLLVGTDKETFEIECIEIFAVGGDESINRGLAEQLKDRYLRDDTIRKAQQCDKAAFLNGFDTELIMPNTFKHRSEVQGDIE